MLNINNNDLTFLVLIYLTVSDSQNVTILPFNKQIVMKKNRDFTFAGNVNAGFFKFYSNDGAFQYDSFRINLPMIDSLSFFVVEKSKTPNVKNKTG